MKIIVTTVVDKTWPVHQVSVQTDDNSVIAVGEARNTPGCMDATVQQAAANAIYKMERQLEQAREHMMLNGLLKEKKS